MAASSLNPTSSYFPDIQLPGIVFTENPYARLALNG